MKLFKRRRQILDVTLLPDTPEGRLVGNAVMRSRAPFFLAGIGSFFAKARGTIHRTIALSIISLCVLGAGSEKAAAQAAAPVLTSATSTSSTSVTLTWTESGTNAGWYRVLYGTSSGNYTATADFGNVLTGTVTGLFSGTTYYFAVLFYENGTPTPFGPSNELSCQVSGSPTPTPTPAPGAQVTGRWVTLPYPMTINPIHANVLRNGKVLIVAGSENEPNKHLQGSSKAAVWDLAAQTITVQPMLWDVFCNGGTFLPMGAAWWSAGRWSMIPFMVIPESLSSIP